MEELDSGMLDDARGTVVFIRQKEEGEEEENGKREEKWEEK